MSDQLSSDLASLRIDRQAKKRPAGGGGLKAVAIGVVVVASLGAAVVALKPRIEAAFFKTEVDITEIQLVSPAQASIELTSTGYVVPQVVSLVGAQLPGRALAVHVKEGDNVTQGELLMELDPAQVLAQQRASEARLTAARARAQAARAEVAETRVQLDRETNLSAQGLSPKANAENLAAHLASLQANVAASDADSASAASDVKTAAVNLSYLKIYSPINGKVVSKPPQAGELVGALTLTPLTIEVADMSSLMVETDVPEPRLEQVHSKAPCEIVLDAYPSKRFRGEVYEVSPKVNRQKATVQVKVRFIDPTDEVLPEMAARVSFLTQDLDETAVKAAPKLVVPGAAVVNRGGGKAVFVVDRDVVKLTPIRLGAPFGSGFEVLDGAAAGTRVVKSPPAALADGESVKQKGEE